MLNKILNNIKIFIKYYLPEIFEPLSKSIDREIEFTVSEFETRKTLDK